MALQPTHDLHKRRLGRNIGVAGLLLGFVILVFLLTMVKIQRGEPVQGFDHVPRPELVPKPAETAGQRAAEPATDGGTAGSGATP